MNKEEALRRIRALTALPPEDRPISIYRFEKLAGLSANVLYAIARTGDLGPKTLVRVSLAFERLENNQFQVGKRKAIAGAKPGGSKKAETVIVPPNPPMVMVRRVHFTATGPKVQLVPTNPLAFPDLTPKKQ